MRVFGKRSLFCVLVCAVFSLVHAGEFEDGATLNISYASGSSGYGLISEGLAEIHTVRTNTGLQLETGNTLILGNDQGANTIELLDGSTVISLGWLEGSVNVQGGQGVIISSNSLTIGGGQFVGGNGGEFIGIDPPVIPWPGLPLPWPTNGIIIDTNLLWDGGEIIVDPNPITPVPYPGIPDWTNGLGFIGLTNWIDPIPFTNSFVGVIITNDGYIGSFTNFVGIGVVSNYLLEVWGPEEYGIFIGGNGGVAQGLHNAYASGGSGRFLNSSAESTNKLKNFLAMGGDGGTALGTNSVIARGGHAFEVSDSARLVIESSTLVGGDGGEARQLINRNTSGRIVDASGGAGVWAGYHQEMVFTNIVAFGGNGGWVHSENSNQFALADGGAGARMDYGYRDDRSGSISVLFSNRVSLIEESLFVGGNGGVIDVAGPPNGWIGYSATSARGGAGLDLPAYRRGGGSNRLMLNSVQAFGGDGGQIVGDRLAGYAMGGSGAEIQGFTHVDVVGGVYQGGRGGSLFSLNNGSEIVAGGGAGMQLIADSATIHNGYFLGGDGSRLASGSGLFFRGNSLEIIDGMFWGEAHDRLGTGLSAIASESVDLHGGVFSSVSVFSGNTGQAHLYVSDDVFIDRGIQLGGDIRISTIEPGTLQQVEFDWGDLVLGDRLVLESDGAWSIGGHMTATELFLQSDSEMALHAGQVEVESLYLEEGAKLYLELGVHTNNNEFFGDQRKLIPSELHAGVAAFESGARLSAGLNWQDGTLGMTQDVVRIYADSLLLADGTNLVHATESDLFALLEEDDDLLMDYLLTLESTPEGELVRISGVGVGVVNRTNLPVPYGIAQALDRYRTSSNKSEDPNHDKFNDLLSALNHEEADSELERYFNQTASPMVLSVVQAGGQAQLDQVLQHTDSARQMGGLATSRPTPEGAAGPNSSVRTGWNGWSRGYGSDISKDREGTFGGYDADIAGAVIGVERVFERGLVGVAGGTACTDLTTDDADKTKVDSTSGMLYGSCGTKDWFVDANLAYRRNEVTTRRDTFSLSEADYDAGNWSGYLGGGRQIQVNERFVVSPAAGIQVGYYEQDGFLENGGLNNRYADYERWSYQTTLGVNAATILYAGDHVSFSPELGIHWNHEFNAEEDRIAYITEETSTWDDAAIQAPEADTLGLEAALTTSIRERIDLEVRAEHKVAEGWSSTTYGGTVKVRF